MSWFTILTIITGFAVSVICLPSDSEVANAPSLSATNLISKNEEGSVQRTKFMQLGNRSTISSDSVNQHPLSENPNGKIISTTLFVIDVIEVKNNDSDDFNDSLHNDIIKELPACITVINDEDKSDGITLDGISNRLQEEGFAVEKVIEDGKIHLIKLLNEVKLTEVIPIGSKNVSNTLQKNTKIQNIEDLSSSRIKRSVCLNCTIVIKQKNPNRGRGGGGYRGRCRGGCGRSGHRPQRVRPVYLQPVYQTVYQYHPQPVYQPPQSVYQYPQQYHTQPQKCNTCGQGQSNSGGDAYAQASAQASASASSSSYGR